MMMIAIGWRQEETRYGFWLATPIVWSRADRMCEIYHISKRTGWSNNWLDENTLVEIDELRPTDRRRLRRAFGQASGRTVDSARLCHSFHPEPSGTPLKWEKILICRRGISIKIIASQTCHPRSHKTLISNRHIKVAQAAFPSRGMNYECDVDVGLKSRFAIWIGNVLFFNDLSLFIFQRRNVFINNKSRCWVRSADRSNTLTVCVSDRVLSGWN